MNLNDQTVHTMVIRILVFQQFKVRLKLKLQYVILVEYFTNQRNKQLTKRGNDYINKAIFIDASVEKLHHIK